MMHDFPELKIGERGSCKRCGRVVVLTECGDLTKVFPACGEKSLGLGDRVAVFFAGLGIEPCEGCNRRKELLNKLGEWFSQITA